MNPSNLFETDTRVAVSDSSVARERVVRRNDRLALGLSGAIISVAVVAWMVALILGIQVSVWLTPRPEPAMHMRLAKMEAAPELDVGVASHGRDVFQATCATCHGPSGLGVMGLGKDLVRSDFVADRSDAELVAFIVAGRAAEDPLNTTKVAMPPRAGNPNLTDNDLEAVVAYVRGLQDPRRLPPLLPAMALAAPPPTQAETEAALSAAGGDAELAQYIASGRKLYASTCAACHGHDAKGLKNLGKDLTTSAFVIASDDDTLLEFIKKGRNPGEPGNTTGVAMPPKGGNPAFSEDDILDVIAYLRTLTPAKEANSASK